MRSMYKSHFAGAEIFLLDESDVLAERVESQIDTLLDGET